MWKGRGGEEETEREKEVRGKVMKVVVEERGRGGRGDFRKGKG